MPRAVKEWHKFLARLQLTMNTVLHNYTFENLSFYFNLSKIIRPVYHFPDFIDWLVLRLRSNLQPLLVTMAQRKFLIFRATVIPDMRFKNEIEHFITVV
jgi:hypothetical protein